MNRTVLLAALAALVGGLVVSHFQADAAPPAAGPTYQIVAAPLRSPYHAFVLDVHTGTVYVVRSKVLVTAKGAPTVKGMVLEKATDGPPR